MGVYTYLQNTGQNQNVGIREDDVVQRIVQLLSTPLNKFNLLSGYWRLTCRRNTAKCKCKRVHSCLVVHRQVNKLLLVCTLSGKTSTRRENSERLSWKQIIGERTTTKIMTLQRWQTRAASELLAQIASNTQLLYACDTHTHTHTHTHTKTTGEWPGR